MHARMRLRASIQRKSTSLLPQVLVNDLGGSLGGVGGSARPAASVVEEIKAAGGTAIADFHSVEDGAAIIDAGESRGALRNCSDDVLALAMT